MALFDFIKRKPSTHEEKINAAYQRFNESMIGAIFPKGKVQASTVICSLAVICGMDLNALDEKDYFNILKIYVDVFIRKQLTQNDNRDIIERIYVLHERFIKSKVMARNVVVYTIMNMMDHDFVLSGEQDIALLMPPQKSSGVVEKANSTEHAFYFQNAVEMITYGAHVEGGDSVRWLEGNNYIDLFKKGYKLVEIGQLEEAIEVLKESLVWNPIGVEARFEMCEAYIQLRDFKMARSILFDMANYLYDPVKIARLYRRIGFIATEEENYLCAAASFMYSKRFEDHVSVNEELLYIQSKGGFEIRLSEKDIITLLQANNIPILGEYEEE